MIEILHFLFHTNLRGTIRNPYCLLMFELLAIEIPVHLIKSSWCLMPLMYADNIKIRPDIQITYRLTCIRLFPGVNHE